MTQNWRASLIFGRNKPASLDVELISKPFFVAGAPRTGTTLLHALLCTSNSFNKYLSECSHFTGLLTTYLVTEANFKVHAKDYFESTAQYRVSHGTMLKFVLNQISTHLNSPKLLALKDPFLTPHIQALASMIPEAKFLVAVRDPRDTVASRLKVVARAAAGAPWTEADLVAACTEYNNMYANVIASWAAIEHATMLVDYNRLVDGELTASIGRFCDATFATGALWSESLTSVEQSEWLTPLYWNPMSTASVGAYKQELDPETVAIITERCGPTARQLGIGYI